MHIEFPTATRIYRCCGSPRLGRQRVKHSAFKLYCLELKKFVHDLGEESSEEFWKLPLRLFNKYRYRMCAAPIPFDHAIGRPKNSLLQTVGSDLARCKFLYPSFADSAESLLHRFNEMSQSSDNPLLDRIAEICVESSGKNIAILIRDSYLVPHIESIIASSSTQSGIEVLVPESLKGRKCYGKIVAVGPASWYPEYVFTAPRAPDISIVQFSWIRDGWKHEPVFVGSERSNIGISMPDVDQTEAEDNTRSLGLEDVLNVDELIPRTDWRGISKKIAGRSEQIEEIDEIEAKLYALEEGFYAFLEAAPDARILAIDLEGDDEESGGFASVKRIPALDIDVGIFVLLRTSGGGDYIVSVADKKMGEKAGPWREMQKHWKNRLREAVRSKGIIEVCIELLILDCEKANEANVRRWMSEKSIKTQSYQDFAAIMNLVDLGSEASKYWEIASAIDSAHRSAGFHIRNLLLKQVLSSDLEELAKVGVMQFELSEADGGTLTALRVKDISPETFKIPSYRIGRPFKGDD